MRNTFTFINGQKLKGTYLSSVSIDEIPSKTQVGYWTECTCSALLYQLLLAPADQVSSLGIILICIAFHVGENLG